MNRADLNPDAWDALEQDSPWEDDLWADDPWDDDADALERFQERGHRLARKPPRRRNVASLLVENLKDRAPDDRRTFDDPGLEELHRLGFLHTLETMLKTGKEATVYVGRGPDGLLAVKLYVDSRVRGFKNDALYRENRIGPDARTKKAMDQRSEYGISAQNILWVAEEYAQLHSLHFAGVPVPRPIFHAGNAVLMEFIGDEDTPAPRLSDAKLSPLEAEDAFEQAVSALERIVGTGRVHGDYSTFNLLWWRGRVVVIDFPQVVRFSQNPSAGAILERDVHGLCKTFTHHGLRMNPDKVLERVRRSRPT